MNLNQIVRVWLTPEAVWLALATDEERKKYTLSYFGIHWPEIDEDLSFDGFFK